MMTPGNDDRGRAQAQLNVIESWRRVAERDLSAGGAVETGHAHVRRELRTIAQASLFGLRARTKESLLGDRSWSSLLSALPKVDARDRSREKHANELADQLGPLLETCRQRFETYKLAYESTGSPPCLDEPDPVIQLVDSIDALSRAGIAMTWLIDSGECVEAVRAREVLHQLQQLLTRVGNRADCIAAAGERLEAMRSTFDERVLSADAIVRMTQCEAVGTLSKLDQSVRRSAMWVAAASGRVFWAIGALREAEDEGSASEGDPYDLVAVLREWAALRNEATQSAWAAAAARKQPWESADPWSAARILISPPLLAAADGVQSRPSLNLRWIDALTDASAHEARCTIREGDSKAVVRFFKGGEIDQSIHAVVANWLGLSATADGGIATFDLARLYGDHPQAELAKVLADRLGELQVGASRWRCKSFKVHGLSS